MDLCLPYKVVCIFLEIDKIETLSSSSCPCENLLSCVKKRECYTQQGNVFLRILKIFWKDTETDGNSGKSESFHHLEERLC